MTTTFTTRPPAPSRIFRPSYGSERIWAHDDLRGSQYHLFINWCTLFFSKSLTCGTPLITRMWVFWGFWTEFYHLANQLIWFAHYQQYRLKKLITQGLQKSARNWNPIWATSGNTFLPFLGRPSKSHHENENSCTFLQSPHQVATKNFVKYILERLFVFFHNSTMIF